MSVGFVIRHLTNNKAMTCQREKNMTCDISTNQAKILLKNHFCVTHENFDKNVGDVFFVKYTPGDNWDFDDYPDMIGLPVYSNLKVQIVAIQKPENPYVNAIPKYVILQLLEELK
jgi:hypothetical protein